MIEKDKCIDALRMMLNSRFFEEKTEELFKAGLIHGTTHLANGQEAAQAGLCMALDDGDWIVPTHRCHGFTICKGSWPVAMFAEMFGSRQGLAKGLGGSMHMPDKENCNLGSSAVVGSGVPLATGIAFYQKFQSTGSAAFATSTAQNPKDLAPVPVKNISVAIFGERFGRFLYLGAGLVCIVMLVLLYVDGRISIWGFLYTSIPYLILHVGSWLKLNRIRIGNALNVVYYESPRNFTILGILTTIALW